MEHLTIIEKNAFVITDTGDVYISGTIHCKEIIHDM